MSSKIPSKIRTFNDISGYPKNSSGIVLLFLLDFLHKLFQIVVKGFLCTNSYRNWMNIFSQNSSRGISMSSFKVSFSDFCRMRYSYRTSYTDFYRHPSRGFSSMFFFSLELFTKLLHKPLRIFFLRIKGVVFQVFSINLRTSHKITSKIASGIVVQVFSQIFSKIAIRSWFF